MTEEEQEHFDDLSECIEDLRSDRDSDRTMLEESRQRRDLAVSALQCRAQQVNEWRAWAQRVLPYLDGQPHGLGEEGRALLDKGVTT